MIYLTGTRQARVFPRLLSHLTPVRSPGNCRLFPETSEVPVSQLMTPTVCEGAVLPSICWTAALEGMPQNLSGMPSAR